MSLFAKTPPDTLTPLERDLMDYLKDLASQFEALEMRSTEMIYHRQDRLEGLLDLLFASQASLIEGLSDFVNRLEPGASDDLQRSMELIRTARDCLASGENP